MSDTPIAGSGDGSRPVTSGGVDNIGGGEKFSSTRNRAGEDVSGPAPKERMQAKRKNAQATAHDDSAAFGLTENLTPETNKEPAAPSQPAPSSQSSEASQPLDPAAREDAIRRAAYAAYERRGGEGGHETQDWLDAEAEVDRQRAP